MSGGRAPLRTSRRRDGVVGVSPLVATIDGAAPPGWPPTLQDEPRARRRATRACRGLVVGVDLLDEPAEVARCLQKMGSVQPRQSPRRLSRTVGARRAGRRRSRGPCCRVQRALHRGGWWPSASRGRQPCGSISAPGAGHTMARPRLAARGSEVEQPVDDRLPERDVQSLATTRAVRPRARGDRVSTRARERT